MRHYIMWACLVVISVTAVHYAMTPKVSAPTYPSPGGLGPVGIDRSVATGFYGKVPGNTPMTRYPSELVR